MRAALGRHAQRSHRPKVLRTHRPFGLAVVVRVWSARAAPAVGDGLGAVAAAAAVRRLELRVTPPDGEASDGGGAREAVVVEVAVRHLSLIHI